MVGDDPIKVKVEVMTAHCFKFSEVLLYDHLSEDGILGFKDGHFGTLPEELAFVRLVEGEVGAAQLEVAPILKILEFQGPGSS